jgi:hypothetical protein
MFNADMIDNNDAHFMLTLSPACAHLSVLPYVRLSLSMRCLCLLVITIDLFTIETHVNRDTILTFMTTHGYKWIAKLYEDDMFMKE